MHYLSTDFGRTYRELGIRHGVPFGAAPCGFQGACLAVVARHFRVGEFDFIGAAQNPAPKVAGYKFLASELRARSCSPPPLCRGGGVPTMRRKMRLTTGIKHCTWAQATRICQKVRGADLFWARVDAARRTPSGAPTPCGRKPPQTTNSPPLRASSSSKTNTPAGPAAKSPLPKPNRASPRRTY